MQKLALTVRAESGETPASLASRIAARNFVSARDFAKDFGISFQSIVDGDEVEIRRLAALADVDARDLLPNAIRKIGTMYELRGQLITKPSIRRARVHVCPLCIQEDIAHSDLPASMAAYGRAEWTVASIRTCGRHKIALVEVKRDLPPGHLHDFARNVEDALPRIDELADKAPRRPLSGMETYLLGRLDGKTEHRWLDQMPFYAAARTIETVGAVAAFGKRVNMDKLLDDDWYEAGGAGLDVLRGGAAGLADFMTMLKSEHAPKNGRASADGPQAVYGKLFMTYAQGLPDPAYDPVRQAMADHILATFPLGPGDFLFGRPVEVRRFHSVRTASIAYEMHPKRLRKLVEAEGLIPNAGLADRDILFDAAVADRLFRREAEALSLKDVEKYLNAPRPTAQVLLQAGLIRRHATGLGQMNEQFFRTEMDEFVASLYRRAVVVTAPTEAICDVATAAKRTNASTADIVRLVLEDRLSWVGHLRGMTGVMGLLVNVEEIRPLVRLPELAGVVPAEAVSVLRVNSKVIRGLMERRVFKTVLQRHPIKRNMTTVIPHEEIDRFNRLYVSLFNLARERGKHMSIVRRDLEKLGVYPAPELNSVGATFFRRSDVSFAVGK